jgi:hypothetical protein
MNVQQALWYMIEKIHFNDYDFKDEFIEMIKTNSEYDGLYDILYLSICKKFNMLRNSWNEIKSSNPYPLVQLLINNYNSHNTFFEFEEDYNYAKQTLALIYEELDKIFEGNKYNSEPHTNILILFSYVLTRKIEEVHKYPDNPIVQKCVSFLDMNKVIGTRNSDSAFAHNQLTTVIIPNTVTNIGNSAFRDNKLTTVTMSNTVTYIGDNAFLDNVLITVTIPPTVQNIGNYAFAHNKLTTVTIPETVKFIGNYAFSDNELTDVNILGTVESIGFGAFSDNRLSSIKKIIGEIIRNKDIFGKQKQSLPLVRQSLPLVRQSLPLVRQSLPLVRQSLPLVRQS